MGGPGDNSEETYCFQRQSWQNEDSTFEKHSKDIYPTELELKKENNSNSSASFLDIYIYIENREFHAKSFDKQDNFESYCKDAILLLHCP